MGKTDRWVGKMVGGEGRWEKTDRRVGKTDRWGTRMVGKHRLMRQRAGKDGWMRHTDGKDGRTGRAAPLLLNTPGALLRNRLRFLRRTEFPSGPTAGKGYGAPGGYWDGPGGGGGGTEGGGCCGCGCEWSEAGGDAGGDGGHWGVLMGTGSTGSIMGVTVGHWEPLKGSGGHWDNWEGTGGH